MRALLTVLVATVLTCSISAQVKVGDKAAWPEAKSIGFTKMKTLNEAKGKLVLLDYFAHW